MREVEQDKILDHEYDGIREYDNPLPSWWVLLFVVSIVFSVGYWFYYQWGEGETVVGQYDRQMLALADIQTKQLLKMGPISDKMIFGIGHKQDLMKSTAGTFAAKCAVCHGAAGEGKIGPNLTDDYWLHGGRLTEIFHTISEGVLEKGMISWKTQMGPGEMLALAAYIGSLHGTNPPSPKAPQGPKIEVSPYELAEKEAPVPPSAGAKTAAPSPAAGSVPASPGESKPAQPAGK